MATVSLSVQALLVGSCMLMLSASSSDAQYNNVPVNNIALTVTYAHGLLLNQTSITLTAGASVSTAVTLTAGNAPTHDIVVSVSSSNTAVSAINTVVIPAGSTSAHPVALAPMSAGSAQISFSTSSTDPNYD